MSTAWRLRQAPIALLALGAALCCAQRHPSASYRHDGAYVLPDAKVTPGAVDPRAIADLTGERHIVGGIERNICADDFRTKPIRATIRDFPKLKKEACAEYASPKCDRAVEGDHLISLELGGCPDCLANQWPQPMAQAKIKDHYVEDVLPNLVCAGKMTLKEAQGCIADDWVACGRRWGNLK